MKILINAPALEVDAELAEFVRSTTRSATSNGDRDAGVAFAELDRSDVGDGLVVRCFIRVEREGKAPIQAGATGTDAREAVQKVARLLEAGTRAAPAGSLTTKATYAGSLPIRPEPDREAIRFSAPLTPRS